MPFEINPYLKLTESFLGVFPDFTVIKLLGLVGLGWAFLQLMQGRVQLGLLESVQVTAFAVFLAAVVFAAIVGGAWILAVTRLLSIVFFLPLTLTVVRTEADLWRVLKTAAMVMVLIFPYGFRQVIRYGGRFGVGLYEPNYLALALVLLIPLAFIFARHEMVPWKRKLWMVGFAIIFLEVILTGSRGGFLGLLVVLGLLGVWIMKYRLAAVAGMALLLFMIFVIPTNLAQRLRASGIDSEVEDVGAETSLRVRIEVIQAGMRMIQANPLFGVGFGNFKSVVQDYGSGIAKIAHNTYLELAAELGLPALAAFFWLISVTLVVLWRSGRLAASLGRSDLVELTMAVRIGLLGYLVSATFVSAEFEKFFWLVVFLTVCLERVVKGLAVNAKSIGQRGLAP